MEYGGRDEPPHPAPEGGRGRVDPMMETDTRAAQLPLSDPRAAGPARHPKRLKSRRRRDR